VDFRFQISEFEIWDLRLDDFEVSVFGVGYCQDQGVERGGVCGFQGSGYGLQRGAGGHYVVDHQNAFTFYCFGSAEAESFLEVVQSLLPRAKIGLGFGVADSG
jgi:hypothetical protein